MGVKFKGLAIVASMRVGCVDRRVISELLVNINTTSNIVGRSTQEPWVQRSATLITLSTCSLGYYPSNDGSIISKTWSCSNRFQAYIIFKIVSTCFELYACKCTWHHNHRTKLYNKPETHPLQKKLPRVSQSCIHTLSLNHDLKNHHPITINVSLLR